MSRHPTCHTTIDSNYAPFLFLKPPLGLPRGDSLAPYIDKKDDFCSNIYFGPKNVKSYNKKRKIGQFLKVVQNYHLRPPLEPAPEAPRGSLGAPQGSKKIQVS